jgi:hypothetical protein
LFEELTSGTYTSASSKLRRLGHVKRADALYDWPKKVGEKKNFLIWSKFGQYRIDIFKDIYSKGQRTTEKMMAGDFYLGLSLDEESIYNGSVSEWFDNGHPLIVNFYLGFMSADESTSSLMNTVPEIRSNEWRGMVWDTNLCIKFTGGNGSKEILKSPIVEFSSMDRYFAIASDRKNAIKLKNFIIDVFLENIVIEDSDNNPGGSIEKLKELLLEVTGSEETFNKIQENIKNISVNSFFKD